MIHDLLFALNGWAGDIFSEKILPNGQSLISYDNGPELSRICGNMLGFSDILIQGDLCQISGYVCTIRRFIASSRVAENRSIYKIQLALALQDFLHDTYERLLTKIENEYLSTIGYNITPLSLTAAVGIYKDALQSFVFILNRQADDVPILNAVWQAFSKLHTGVESPSTKAIEKLLLIVVTPFLNQLEEWLNYGAISTDRDPYGEFFLANDGEMRSDRLPPFVEQSVAQKAILIGDLLRELQSTKKSTNNLVRNLCGSSHVGDDLPRLIASSIIKAHKVADFEMAMQLVNAGALQLISQCCDLSFMNRGELFSTWLLSPSVNHILRFNHRPDARHVEKFSGVLASELRIAAQRLYTTSKHESMNVALDSARFELEDLNSKELPRFDVFLFPVTSIPPGLTRVFSAEAVQQYKTVFNYLVFLRSASSALNNAWSSLLITKRGIKGRHQQEWVNDTREMFGQLARMSRALSALEQHAFHVIRCEKEEFLAISRKFDDPYIKQSESRDCDTFVMAHAKMISKIAYELVRPSQNFQLRSSLVTCILNATALDEKIALLQETQQQCHLSPSEFDKFAPLLALLLRQQTMILGSLSILPLHSLLLSLDFNDFYSRQQ